MHSADGDGVEVTNCSGLETGGGDIGGGGETGVGVGAGTREKVAAGAASVGVADGTTSAITVGRGVELTAHGSVAILLASSKLHLSSTASMHEGLKDLNCCKFLNNEAKLHKLPLLLET